MEDTQIVELYLQRNERAIACTAAQYGNQLRSIAYHIVQNHETAEECENDTYLQAWNTIPPHTPHCYLYAYLVRIIRHISIDRCRYQQRLCRNAYIQELSAELQCCIPSSDNAENRLDAIVLGQSISVFLRQQPETARNVFLRRYWFGDSIKDIAAATGLKENAVSVRLNRLRDKLKDYLYMEGYYE